jgi:hypothetical protein
MPGHYAGTIDEFLFAAFRAAGSAVPDSFSQLREILKLPAGYRR